MRIDLEEPYKSIFDVGYLNVGDDGRKRVWFTKDSITVFGTSYARYLMSVKLGYLVPDDLEVDHIDDDKTNDDIFNLQILTKEQNILKQSLSRLNNKVVYGFDCAYCNTSFLLTEADVNYKLSTSKTGLVFCSRSCSRTYLCLINPPGIRTLSGEDISHIRSLRQNGLSSYKISEMTGISRNTVMKYW